MHAEVSPVLPRLLHCTLEDLRWVGQLQLGNAGQVVVIHEVWLIFILLALIVVDLSVHSSLWLILHPLANEKLVLIMIEVTALTLSQVVNPVTFKVVSVSLGENSVTVSLALVPLTLINVLICVDHPTLALWQAIHPVAVVSVAALVEEGTSAVLLVLVPVARILSSKLRSFLLPVRSLPVALVKRPHTLILVSILVELNTEAFLAVVTPVTDILLTRLPHLTLN